jgi:hypothetical protein
MTVLSKDPTQDREEGALWRTCLQRVRICIVLSTPETLLNEDLHSSHLRKSYPNPFLLLHQPISSKGILLGLLFMKRIIQLINESSRRVLRFRAKRIPFEKSLIKKCRRRVNETCSRRMTNYFKVPKRRESLKGTVSSRSSTYVLKKGLRQRRQESLGYFRAWNLSLKGIRVLHEQDAAIRKINLKTIWRLLLTK